MDASLSPSLQSPVRAAAAAKIFVGGITKEVEEDVLKKYFEKYGDVKDAVIVRDRATGYMKGYGFVEFTDSEAADKAINEKGQHLILNRSVVVKRARSRLEERMNSQSSCDLSSDRSTGNSSDKESNFTTGKIFVGGLPSTITGDEFRSYFEKFGHVSESVIMYDKETRRPRGFGFITFVLEEAAQNAVQMRFHELNEKRVEAKLAIPRPSTNNIRISNSSIYLNSSISYQPWAYPAYDHKYGYFYNYASELAPGYGFGPIDNERGYETGYCASYAWPNLTWNEPPTMRQFPIFYPDATFYHVYAN